MAFPPQGTSGNDNYTVAGAFVTLHDGYPYLDGSGGTDTLYLTGGAGSYGDTIFNGVSHFENMVLLDGGWTFVFGSAAAAAFDNHVALDAGAATSLTLDASGLGAGTTLVVYGSLNADSITAGAGPGWLSGNGGADTLVGGAGNDAFYFADGAQLAEAALVEGGGGSNILLMINDSTLTDADWANVHHIQTLWLLSFGAQDVTLGANAAAAAGGRLTVTALNSGSLHVDASAFGPGTSLSANGGTGADWLRGGAGSDYLYGNGGADTLLGGGGNDAFFFLDAGQLDAATVGGGSGVDTLVMQQDVSLVDADFANVSSVEFVRLMGHGVQYVTLGADAAAMAGGFLTVTADYARSIIVDATGYGGGHTLAVFGTGGADGVAGGAGNDFICGNGGADYLLGNGGDDAFFFHSASELAAAAQVDGGAGVNSIVLLKDASLVDSDFANVSHAHILSLQGYGAQSAVLGAHVEAADNGGWFSVVAPHATSLSVDASAFSPAITLSVFGTAGADSLVGGAGNDFFTGNGGADTEQGGGGDDAFFFTSAADITAATVDGGSGNNTVVMLGDAMLTAAALQNVTNVQYLTFLGGGAQGLDTAGLAEPAGHGLTVNAYAAGSLKLDASSWTDTQLWVTGSAGKDTLAGGGGNDWFTGGASADTFVFGHDAGLNGIGDFSVAQGDVLGFHGFSGADVAAILAGAVDVGGTTFLYWDGGASDVVLYGVAKASLSLADFAWS